jgi:glycolate oxidase FAD binding subunit
MMAETILIDGFGPLSVYRPASVADAGEQIRQAVANKLAIYPLGGRTALEIGVPPAKLGIALDLCGQNALIDYPAADMTVTVQAGMTVSALQALLAKERQWLPIDLARPDAATLGGAVAVNTSGPRRLGYGTLRDYLIGISFLTDAGEEVKGGGRVVKNVAGYDLMKLHLGALGTLGIITQLTFKVKPVPEERTVLIFGTTTDRLAATLDLLHATNGRPIAVDVLNAAAAKSLGLPTSSPWTVVVGFEEKAVTVATQLATVQMELALSGDVRTGTDATSVWSKLTDLPCRPESTFVCKASVRPSQVAEILASAEGKVDLIHAHALSGILWLHSAAENTLVIPGTVVTRTAPAEWKTTERVWGKPASDWALKAHIKQTLDPGNVFNAGRIWS